MTDDDARATAELRLEEALEGADLADPRADYRRVLRFLKERNPAGFDRAIRHYEDTLVPAVSGEADPLAAWLEFGEVLVRQLGEGRRLVIGPSGRAHPPDAAPEAGGLVLFLPDDDATPAFPLRRPRPATRAQEATVELLVEGRVTARAYERG